MIARLALPIVYEELLTAMPEFTRLDPQLEWMPSTTFRSPLRLRLARGQ
jgi:hypothetical protein